MKLAKLFEKSTISGAIDVTIAGPTTIGYEISGTRREVDSDSKKGMRLFIVKASSDYSDTNLPVKGDFYVDSEDTLETTPS